MISSLFCNSLIGVFVHALRLCGPGSYIGLYETILAELAFRLFEAKHTKSWEHLEASHPEALAALKEYTKHHPEWML